jgi:hypothetical protein
MNEQRLLRVRRAPIIHDTIDNETIAINQLTGAYYSLEGPSALAWQLLDGGTTSDRIVAALGDRYDTDAAGLADSVGRFVDELVAEELVEQVPAGDAPSVHDRSDGAGGNGIAAGEANGAVAREPFPGLRLNRYTDLEVLLLADPIHEVDETGWPTPLAPPG